MSVRLARPRVQKFTATYTAGNGFSLSIRVRCGGRQARVAGLSILYANNSNRQQR